MQLCLHVPSIDADVMDAMTVNIGSKPAHVRTSLLDKPIEPMHGKLVHKTTRALWNLSRTFAQRMACALPLSRGLPGLLLHIPRDQGPDTVREEETDTHVQR